MDKCKRVTAAMSLLMWVSCVFITIVPVASAQPREPVLVLVVEDGIVPAAALQGALEAELGVGVELRSNADPSVPTVSVSRLASGNVEVALASRSVPRATRQLVLRQQVEQERVETLSLIASNLVRNEAAALLPDLRPARAAEVSAPAPGGPTSSVEREPDPCDLAQGGGFGFDFAPGVGSSSTPEGRAATRRFSLGFIGTLSGRLNGFELSVGANIQRLGACGVQLAAGANVSLGSVRGAQLAQFNLVRGRMRGAQLGTVNLTTGSVSGMQGGILNGAGRGSYGAQLAVANYTGGRSDGLQGGVANLAVGHAHGAQLGVANVATGGVHGLQGGVANVSVGALRGAQLGVANVATGAAGVQVGVFNYADSSRASIGVLSVVRRGRTSVDLTGAIESGILLAGVTHGGKYVHNTLGIGVRTTQADGQQLALSLGIGVRALRRGRVFLDVDATHVNVLGEGGWDGSTMISGLRVPVTVQVAGGFGLMIAPSYQVLVTDDPGASADSLFGRTRFLEPSRPDDTRVVGFPGLTVGLRYQFDHGA